MSRGERERSHGVRRVMALQIACGLWKPKRRKAKRAFGLRKRRPRFGELICPVSAPLRQIGGVEERRISGAS